MLMKVLLFRHMAESTNDLTHQMTRLVYYSSRQKVADFLLQESRNRFLEALPYTHEEIAQSVCLNRVTVSRILSDFKKAGWVKSRHGTVTICDKKGLERLLPEFFPPA